MKVGKYVDVAVRINCNNFGYPLIFNPVPPSCQKLSSTLFDVEIPQPHTTMVNMVSIIAA